MAKRKFNVLNALNKGKGLGEYAEYTPWLKVKDVSSKGFSNTVLGIKARREHYFLSTPELECFFLCEFNSDVLDVREQFPLLDIELIERITQQLKVRPSLDRYNGKSEPRIFTTDLLLTIKDGRQTKYEAISVKKDSASLTSKRALELQEIERLYWNLQGVKWSLFIPSDSSTTASRNIEFLTNPIRVAGIDNNLNASDMEFFSLLTIGRHNFIELIDNCSTQLGASHQQCKVSLAKLFFTRLIDINLESDISDTGLLSISHFNTSDQRGVHGNIA